VGFVENLVLVDTSVFVDYLRGVADDTLSILILNNQVLLSPVVRFELMVGVRKSESSQVERLFKVLIPIENFCSLSLCESVLLRAKGSGLLGGLPDLMILADAISHKAMLFSTDKKMLLLAKKLRLNVLNG